MHKLLGILLLGASCSMLGTGETVVFPYPMEQQGVESVLIRRDSIGVLLDEEVRQFCDKQTDSPSGEFLHRMGKRVDLASPDAEEQCWKFVEDLHGRYDSKKLKTIMGSEYPSKCKSRFDTWVAARRLELYLRDLRRLKSQPD